MVFKCRPCSGCRLGHDKLCNREESSTVLGSLYSRVCRVLVIDANRATSMIRRLYNLGTSSFFHNPFVCWSSSLKIILLICSCACFERIVPLRREVSGLKARKIVLEQELLNALEVKPQVKVTHSQCRDSNEC